MQTNPSGPDSPDSKFSSLTRRIREFSLIGRDPVLSISLLLSGIFIFVFVVFPLFRSASGGFISKEGTWDVTYFARYFDSYFGPALRQSFYDTMQMGLMTAAAGTLVGFISPIGRPLPDPRQAHRALAGACPHRFAALCPGIEHDLVVRAQRFDHQKTARHRICQRDE
jgi:hypothetical protein